MNPKEDTLNPNAVFCHPGKRAKLSVNSTCARLFGVGATAPCGKAAKLALG